MIICDISYEVQGNEPMSKAAYDSCAEGLMLSQQDSNEYVRAALLAAEEGVRAAATGALPLAAPIVERVGGWEAVDDWACRGIDRVAQAAPIITKPTEEVKLERIA